MKLISRKEQHDIVLEVVDSLYEKLANELDYHLMDLENYRNDDKFEDLFEEMTIQTVNQMKKQLYVQL